MSAPLRELDVTFVPLDLIAEWTRCGETADYLACYLAHDFEHRETAAIVLSTIINELVENAAKFSADKRRPVRIVVRQFGDRIAIEATNSASRSQASTFRETVARIVAEDPEALFAERVAHPPDIGGAGIGLIVLRKDYRASIDVQVESDPGPEESTRVQVRVTVDNREVEQR
jgi:hypothetical protein